MHSLAFILLILSLSATGIRAQTQEIFDHASLKERGSLSTDQLAALEKKFQVIEDESQKSNDEWTGHYSLETSPTSGTRFDWSPKNGFVVWWNTCSYGLRDEVDFGKVDANNEALRLSSTLGAEGEKVYPTPADLVKVKWGDQHYLVPTDRLIAFAYAARNVGRSYEINEFFLKESDRDKRRYGLPEVPARYKKYLVSAPILATIVEVKSDQKPSTGFTLNVGSKAGVARGMKFFAIYPRNIYMLVEVIEVSENNSEAYAITSGFKNHNEKVVIPAVGWKLTSRAPKRAFEYYPG